MPNLHQEKSNGAKIFYNLPLYEKDITFQN
jgi:hypothetical protein